MNYKDLYRPNLYFDDPKVELYSKRRGFIKKKVGGIRDHLGFNKGSTKVYCCFQRRGRFLCFYNDMSRKEGELIDLIQTSAITEIDESVKDKVGHFMLKTKSNGVLHLKCNDIKETNEWIKTIKFFKDYYNDTKNKDLGLNSASIDQDTYISILAENELDNWDVIAPKFDYTSFIHDKGLSVLFENNILELIKNRLLISNAQKETKHKKGGSIVEPQTPQTPQTPLTPSLRFDKLNLNAIRASHYYLVLICQRPIYYVDQEFALTDDIILEKDSLPEWMEFNKLYYFQHSAPGDITTFKKSLEVT